MKTILVILVLRKKINENGYHAKDAIVIDNNVITSQGPATAMIFALEIVNMLCDKETYDSVKKWIISKRLLIFCR